MRFINNAVHYNLRSLFVTDILRLNSSVKNLISLTTIFHYSLPHHLDRPIRSRYNRTQHARAKNRQSSVTGALSNELARLNYYLVEV